MSEILAVAAQALAIADQNVTNAQIASEFAWTKYDAVARAFGGLHPDLVREEYTKYEATDALVAPAWNALIDAEGAWLAAGGKHTYGIYKD